MFTVKVIHLTRYDRLIAEIDLPNKYKTVRGAINAGLKHSSNTERLYPWSQQVEIKVYENGVFVET